MSFVRLLESDRGKILLINLHHTLRSALLPPAVSQHAVKNLHHALSDLARSYRDQDLVNAVGEVVWFDDRFQLAGTEAPADTLRLAIVKTLGDVRPLFVHIRKTHRPHHPSVLDSLLSPGPAPADVVREAVDVLNAYAEQMDTLILGATFDALWATCAEALATAVSAVPDPGETAHQVRDCLGLVQMRPSTKPAPMHLLLFEAAAPLTDLRMLEHFRAVRPTTLDGFDNARFRQARSRATGADGCGQTVDLSGGRFGEGLPEIISTALPLRGRFRCRYVGELIRDPEGVDEDFVRYIAGADDMAEFARELDAYATTW